MKILKSLLPYVIIVIVVVIIRSFVVTPIRVVGPSMDDTLKDGDILLLKKYDKSYNRYDIVVINYENERIIKRVIGLPGEEIECKNGKIYINGEIIDDIHIKDVNYDFTKEKIKEGYYFVLGDNRKVSNDSRYFGPVSKDKILGTVDIRLFPFNKIGKIKSNIEKK